MPLVPAAMSSAIQTEIIAAFGAPQDAATLAKFADAVAMAVVTQIQTTAQVVTTVAGGSSSGPHPGVIL